MKAKKRDKRERSTRTQAEKAQRALEREILRNVPPELKSAFKRWRDGATNDILLGVLGLELHRLQNSLGDREPDFRYSAAVQKTLEAIRRVLLAREENAAFIPDKVVLTLDRGADNEEDFSDEPEFE